MTVDSAIDRELPGPAGPIPARVLVPPGRRRRDAVPPRRRLVHRQREGRRARPAGSGHEGQRRDGQHRLPPRARASLSRAGPTTARRRRCGCSSTRRPSSAPTDCVIGGGSAGGHLSVLTLLRLRDRHDALDAVTAANLVAGAFDLGMTPSQRTQRGRAGHPARHARSLLPPLPPGLDREARRDPSISPLYADLTGMPPALFTTGTLDPAARRLALPGQPLACRRLARRSWPSTPRPCTASPRSRRRWRESPGTRMADVRRAPSSGAERRHDSCRWPTSIPNAWRLRLYDRVFLRGDLLAGVTVAAYLIPQCMAYAELAGLPPIVGLVGRARADDACTPSSDRRRSCRSDRNRPRR